MKSNWFGVSILLFLLREESVYCKNLWVETSYSWNGDSAESIRSESSSLILNELNLIPEIPSKPLAFQFKLQSKSKVSLSGAIPAQPLASTLVITGGIGTPPKPMNLLLDTGSSLFWVRSKTCRLPICTRKPQFDSSLSDSYQSLNGQPNQHQFIQYGDGTKVNCSVNQDSISLGSLVIANQKICEAYSIITTTPETDGIIGLGPPDGKRSAADFMQQFASLGYQPMVSFVYNLGVNSDVKGGSLLFGGMDSNRYDSSKPVQWVNITSDRSYWRLKLISITNSFNDQLMPSTQNFSVVVDSGTTQTFFPVNVAASINAQMGASLVNGQYVVDCKNVENIQSLTLLFDGASSGGITLNKKQLIIRHPTRNICYSVFQSTTSVPIIGAWFLKSFYTSFDYRNARIGFATPLKNDDNNEKGSTNAAGSSARTGKNLANYLSIYSCIIASLLFVI